MLLDKVVRRRDRVVAVDRELLFDQVEQGGWLDRLHHVAGAEAICIRTQYSVVEAGDDDGGNSHAPGRDQLQTVEGAEADIDDEQVRRMFSQSLFPVVEAAGEVHDVPRVFQQFLHPFQINLVVVYDQNTSTHPAAPVILDTR